ncbi:MAG: TIR domain-containing protein [Verrucomicrobia bacterium]|nr:TIR domain-containing protein [Verrucomicrobiota bacterium]
MGRKWSNWLHEALESYEVPPDLIGKTSLRGDKVPAALYPVFRDEVELPADADLSTNIRRALENSGLLVVLCSPRAVQSPYVAQEIRYFKELGKSDRILALMIDGEPNASDDPAKVEVLGAAAECFPEPLRFGVAAQDDAKRIDWKARTEPIAADVRPEGRCAQGWTTAAAYREQLVKEGKMTARQINNAVQEYNERLELAKLKIIAGALGLPLGELTQRDKAYRARKFRRLATFFGSMALLSLLGGIIALWQWHAANAERDRAEKQRRVAEIRLAESKAAEARANESGGAWADARERYIESWNISLQLGLPVMVPKLGLMETYHRGPPPLAAWKAHAQDILMLQLDPENPTTNVISAGREGRVCFWDIRFGTRMGSFEVGRLWSAVLSEDGKVLLAGGDSTVDVWDMASQTKRHSFAIHKHFDFVQAIAISPDGQWALSGTMGGDIACWNVADGTVRHRLVGNVLQDEKGRPSPNPVTELKFAPDGKTAVACASIPGIGTFEWWDLVSGKMLASSDTPTSAVVFTKDGQFAFSGGWDGRLKIWDATTHKQIDEIAAHQVVITCMALSDDEETLCTGSGDGTVCAWDLRTKQKVQRMEKHINSVSVVALSGSVVITGAGGPEGGALETWPLRVETDPRVIPAHELGVHALELSADESMIMTGSNDGSAKVWDVATGLELAHLQGGGSVASAVQMDAQGMTAMVGWSPQGKVSVVRLGSAEGPRTFDVPNLIGQAYIRSIAVSADEKELIAAKVDGEADIFSLATGKVIRTVGKRYPFNHAAAISPDRTKLLFALDGDRAELLLWDVPSGKQLAKTPLSAGGIAACFDASGEYFAVATHSKETLLFKTSDPQQPVQHFQRHMGTITAIAISARHGLLASASSDGIKIWDFASGAELRHYELAHGPVNRLTFNRDGSSLFAGTSEGKVLIWDFTRPAEYDEQIPGARKALTAYNAAPDNLELLLPVMKWYEFRGCDTWAWEIMSALREQGRSFPALQSARCATRTDDHVGALPLWKAWAAETPAQPAAQLRVSASATALIKKAGASSGFPTAEAWIKPLTAAMAEVPAGSGIAQYGQIVLAGFFSHRSSKPAESEAQRQERKADLEHALQCIEAAAAGDPARLEQTTRLPAYAPLQQEPRFLAAIEASRAKSKKRP